MPRLQIGSESWAVAHSMQTTAHLLHNLFPGVNFLICSVVVLPSLCKALGYIPNTVQEKGAGGVTRPIEIFF